jgi:hypothetical protein
MELPNHFSMILHAHLPYHRVPITNKAATILLS